MFDKIITVTLNPCFDRTIYLESFMPDEPNRVTSEYVEPGGKGINVSRVLNSLGVSNTAIILGGDKNAGEFTALLNKENINNLPVICDGCVRENLNVITPDKTLYKINRAGDTVTDGYIGQLKDAIISELSEKTLTLFCGSIPKSMIINDYVQLIKDVKNAGSYIGVDSSQLSAEQLIEISPFLIKPNIHELSDIAQKAVKTGADVIAAAEVLKKHITHIIVSMGDKGVQYIGGTETIFTKAVKTDVISTVGAGDALLGGFVYALTQKKDIYYSISFANKTAAKYISEKSIDKTKEM